MLHSVNLIFLYNEYLKKDFILVFHRNYYEFESVHHNKVVAICDSDYQFCSVFVNDVLVANREYVNNIPFYLEEVSVPPQFK